MTLIDKSFREKIVLVGVIKSSDTEESVNESLDELALLVDTAGADVVARVIQRRTAPDPATYVGAGKADEIRDISYQVDSDTVVFDDELTPAQQRNLEKIFGRTAIDRTAVILDVFAQRARTLEGKAQVELALLQYRLPRLRGRGKSLSQQAGMIGTRGPGETQLEVDRRRLMRRITHLEHELKALTDTRLTQRKARNRTRQPVVSMVGYTNAGKSTLFNRITDAGTLVENRLFSTLDTRTRQGTLEGGEVVLFSDTVGFVRKLPHQLVEAFRSTLDEVNDADLLLHVVDASSPDPEGQIAAVREVLEEISTHELPELLIFNKLDRAEPETCERLARLYPESCFISATTGEGFHPMMEALANRLRSLRRLVRLEIPFDRGDVLAMLHREAEVVSEEAGEASMRVTARVDEVTGGRVREFAVEQDVTLEVGEQ